MTGRPGISENRFGDEHRHLRADDAFAPGDPPAGRDSDTMSAATGLFNDALGLKQPWFVERSEFDVEGRHLVLHLSFEQDRTLQCGACGREGCRVYDIRPHKRWRHLDFLEYQTILVAQTPRVNCPSCGVRQAELPWARPRSGFTWAFEHRIAETFASRCSLSAVAEIVDESPHRLRRLASHYTTAPVGFVNPGNGEKPGG